MILDHFIMKRNLDEKNSDSNIKNEILILI